MTPAEDLAEMMDPKPITRDPSNNDEGKETKDGIEEASSTVTSEKIPDEDVMAIPQDSIIVQSLALSRVQKIMLGGTISVTHFMMSLSVGSGLLIIPVMADYYNVSVLAVQWVTSAYQLAYLVSEIFHSIPRVYWICIEPDWISGLLVSGRLADLYGRRKVYLLGMLVSTIANIVSGVISNRIALTVFRAIAGLGLSISAPAGFGIIGITFRQEPSRTMAFAALGVGTPLGAVVGEVVGGLIAGTTKKGWQYLFILILPIITGIIYIPSDDKIAPPRDPLTGIPVGTGEE
ncbi:hypothetical protein V866_008643 [Kwoniella sp. B9012]|uniref:Major facilitator superfamily (MFS) profile domain-containing protein n=1 Tax=Kwoniella europaea PYCC6329 TaxID=1423913 RepID=A0AAX4KW05_9TREE